MNLDKILLFLGLGNVDKDNLNENVRIGNPIMRKDSYHARGSRTMYLLLPPWHPTRFIFHPIKRKLRKLGFSYIRYEFCPDMLTPDICSTEEYFKLVKEVLREDMAHYAEKHEIERFVLLGMSLSCVTASMASDVSPRITGLILVAPSHSLSRALWHGMRTVNIKNAMKKEGISLTELEKDWEDLDPEKYVPHFKNKKVRILLSKSDTIVPYAQGKKFANEVKRMVPDADVRENRFLGHYGTILHFCFVSKKIEL